MKTLSSPDQKIQTEFTRNLNNKEINGDVKLLLAVDRFQQMADRENRKSSDTKEG